MTILDRYIARQYVTNIVLLFIVLFAFVIVIDFSLNFDEFVRIARRLGTVGDQEPSTLRTGALAAFLVMDLWWPRLFMLFGYMLGLVLVGAMGFTCAQLVKSRELVAILAGGVSLYRVARPIIIVAAGALLLQAANREFVLPRLAPLLTRDKQDAGKRELGLARKQLAADSQGRLFYAKSFDLDRGVIDGLWIWERDESGLMTRLITASSARWVGGAWRLTDGRAVDRSPNRGAGTLPPPVAVASVETDLDPTALKLRRYETFRQNLSSAQISELISRYRAQSSPPQARIEAVQRVRWGRYAELGATLLTLVVCLPFFLRREPANMIVQSLFAAPVAIILIVGGVLGTTAAIPGLPPQIAVFVPAIAQLPLTIAALTSIRT